MPKNIHAEPFDSGTKTKLDIFERYLMEWLPVFIEQSCPDIYIVDFFAGPGKDCDGCPGSPLRIINCVFKYQERIKEKRIRIHVIFNELDEKKINELKQNINLNHNLLFYTPEVYNIDFRSLFHQLKPSFIKNPALLFMDQNGISQVTEEILLEIKHFNRTDFIFFISSSYFVRFCEDQAFKKYFPTLCGSEIKESNYDSIHRKILMHFRNIISSSSELRLFPFSIKKGSNIYGLIFGTKNPLGADKFLNITWTLNPINGEANFDIDDDLPKREQKVLFAEFKKMTKLEKFQEDLTQHIAEKVKISNIEIYDFALANGFIHKHAVTIVKDLINRKSLEKMFEGRGLFIGYKQCCSKEKILKYFEWIEQ
jgi:three-Cys-motif partner protein